MYKKHLTFIFSLFCVAGVFASGINEADEKPVKDPASWQETIDINDKSPGKYNFYIRAADRGGNVEISGPYNMFIDPESDLPIAGVTNPRAEMRVPGNLNIVGTCIDDDAVDHVELYLDGQEESPIRAEGKDFWSYYLDTTKMEEGLHTVTVYGVDVNGLAGNKRTVTWHLDRKKPQSAVNNHSLGDLVAGKLVLTGTVFDGNGIASLEYSVDRGAHFLPVSINVNKKTNTASFSLEIDTLSMPDGPAVCWFRAKDMQGSIGIYTFLYFVDNTKPDVRILYPREDKAVNGKFTVAGYAGDAIGLESLSWKMGKESGVFDLTLGNPWWAREFDVSGQGSSGVDLEIIAVDLSGNVTAAKRKILVDPQADLPIVSLVAPQAGSVILGSEIQLTGLVSDDDGVASVFYALDAAAPVEVATDGAFQVRIPGIADGKHSLRVWAKDVNGVVGPAVESVGFVCAGNVPSITLDSIASASGASRPYAYGMEIHPESGANLSLSVTSGSAIKTVAWQFAGLAEESRPLAGSAIVGGTLPVSVPFPKDVPYGPVALLITVTDIHGRSASKQAFFYMTDLTKTRGEPAVIFDDVRVGDDGTVVLDPSYPLSGFFAGGNVAKASLSPSSKLATLERDGNLLRVVPTGVPGSERNVVVSVETDRGRKYTSRAFTFVTPGKVPEISLKDGSLRDGAQAVSVAGAVSADLPPVLARWRLIGPSGPMDAVGDLKLDKAGSFAFTVPADAIPEGPSVIEIQAGTGGPARTVAVPVFRAPQAAEVVGKIPAPVVSFVESGALYYFVTYKGSMASSAVAVDGKPADAQAYPAVGVVPIESLPVGPRAIAVKATDAAGKSVSASYRLSVKAPPARIRLASAVGSPWSSGMQVAIPLEGLKDATIVARVESVQPVLGATWKLGDQTLRSAARKLSETEWEISIPVPAGIPADRISVSVSAEVKDAAPAVASGVIVVVRPKDRSQVNDRESFAWMNAARREDGTIIVDPAVPLYGFYNGRPLKSVATDKSPAGFSCAVEEGVVVVRATADGAYAPGRITVTDVDGWTFRTEAFTFLADSEAPALSIQEPADGAWVRDSVRLRATATDKNKIVSMEYSLDLGATWSRLESLDRSLDLSAREDGIIGLAVRVVDAAGRSAVQSLGIHKDTVAPASSVVVPSEAAKVNGEILLGIALEEAGKIVSVEYQRETAAAGAKKAGAKQGADGSWTSLDPTKFVSCMIGTAERPLTKGMRFRFTDASGNANVLESWPFVIDQETDLPVVELHLPSENEVVTQDFVVSGVVYDDDRAAKIWYKIDNNPETEIAATTGYSIPVALRTLTDNEHSVTVVAEDVYGVRGKPVTRKFRVSLEEPKAQVLKPSFEETRRGIIEISGVASDKNGVARVQVSIDNGNSFNDAVGTESWKYSFDTRIVQDGTHVIFVKVWDKYEIEGFYSSLVNIDNTAPNINLEMPLDGAKTVGPLFVSGQTTDNISLKTVTVSLRSLEGARVPAELSLIKMPADIILTKPLDLSGLVDGLYNIDVYGEDAAGNVTRVSRNVILDKKGERNRIECLYPLNGQHLQGSFNLYGRVYATDPLESVTLYVDGKAAGTAEVSKTGYFRFNLTNEGLAAGGHSLAVRGDFGSGRVVTSADRDIVYAPSGPWVTIDNLAMGDFAFERPWLVGSAGYVLTPEEQALLTDKKADKDARAAVERKRVESVDISFDNGKTFAEVEFDEQWRFRIETQDMPQGYHYMIVRAHMADGATAIARTIIQIDKTQPFIRLISPGEGGRYNQSLEFSGLASDDISLASVGYALRKGDKSSYEVPGFIQGLYFDAHFWGATLWDIGVGLTFFGDNVKLQLQFGQFTQSQWETFMSEEMRYGGNVIGAKLLANVFYLPFAYFAGPDWSWLSANIALGANFSLFTETQSGKAQTLSAVLAQIEFPRVTLPKRKMFRTFSLYTEVQLWFVPTDVSSNEVSIKSLIPHITGGLRMNVF